MDKLHFSVPIDKKGNCCEWIAYPSERRKNTFVAALKTECVEQPPILCTLTPRNNHAAVNFPNFTWLRFTALYEDDEITVHSLEVYVLWRGIEKYKAILPVNGSDATVLYNRWGK